MHDLARLRGHFVDSGCMLEKRRAQRRGEVKGNLPLDTDDEDELGLAQHVEISFLFGEPRKANLFALCLTVFGNIGFSALEDDPTLLLLGLSWDVLVLSCR